MLLLHWIMALDSIGTLGYHSGIPISVSENRATILFEVHALLSEVFIRLAV